MCLLIASLGVGYALTTEMNNQTVVNNTTQALENNTT